jgi:hypothetical protein
MSPGWACLATHAGRQRAHPLAERRDRRGGPVRRRMPAANRPTLPEADADDRSTRRAADPAHSPRCQQTRWHPDQRLSGRPDKRVTQALATHHARPAISAPRRLCEIHQFRRPRHVGSAAHPNTAPPRPRKRPGGMTQGERDSMSAHQGNSACRISVDPSTADVLRIEAKKVLMFNHDPFEDFMDYVPTKQLALADVYRDATAVIDALGWDPEMVPHTDSIEVPLTRGHVEHLHERRCDLLATNLERCPTPARGRPSEAASTSGLRGVRHSDGRRTRPARGVRREGLLDHRDPADHCHHAARSRDLQGRHQPLQGLGAAGSLLRGHRPLRRSGRRPAAGATRDRPHPQAPARRRRQHRRPRTAGSPNDRRVRPHRYHSLR